jgi:hypothetical protein
MPFFASAELAELWEGPQGVEQRAVRLICLAAAAGDLEELQVRKGWFMSTASYLDPTLSVLQALSPYPESEGWFMSTASLGHMCTL